jgi:hypothetical protein
MCTRAAHSKRLAEKRVGADAKIIAVADKAIHRLHKKYIRLTMRRKPGNVAIADASLLSGSNDSGTDPRKRYLYRCRGVLWLY